MDIRRILFTIISFIENGSDEKVAEIVKSLVQNDYSIYRVEEEKKSLEEIFLELTGQEGGL